MTRNAMIELLIDRIASPIGTILIVSDGKNLCALDYADCEDRMTQLLRRRYPRFYLRGVVDPQGFSSRIIAYMKRDFAALADMPVSTGGTPFQRQVWSALRTIATGSVLSYRDMAARLKKPTAYRAVGMTNGLNPVAIVIPCHRMIGSNGALTGYAGGLERKQWLLQHEGIDVVQLTKGFTHASVE